MNNKAWQLFCRSLRKFNHLMSYVSALLILACTLALVYEVVTRYVANVSNDWVIELSIFMLVAATFLAAAHTQNERAHVGIEVLDEVMSRRWNRWRYLLGDTLSALLCAFIAYKAWIYGHEAWSQGWTTSTTWAPKLWIPYFFMAFGMTMLALEFLIQIVEDSISPMLRKEHHYLGE